MSHLYKEFNDIICNCLNKDTERFAIVPFGENGMLLKQILQERYNILDILLVAANKCYKETNTCQKSQSLSRS